MGAVLFGVLGGIAGSSLAADWVPGVRDVLTPAVMGVVLAFQVGALVLARRPEAAALTMACAARGRLPRRHRTYRKVP